MDLHGEDSTSQDVNRRHTGGHVEQSPLYLVGMGRERVSLGRVGGWFTWSAICTNARQDSLNLRLKG